jgi:hypothetical protein
MHLGAPCLPPSRSCVSKDVRVSLPALMSTVQAVSREGGYVHEPMPACFFYRTRSIPSDRLLDEVCLLDEVYIPSDDEV